MADILQEIVAHKRCDLDRLLCKRVSMAEALRQSPSGIIAEFKRKSPSKGWIHADVEPEQVIPRYVEGGAAALSILTNEEYFGGKPEYITRVRGLVGSCPILRKEFIVDPYQVYEARMLGADAILLIAAALAPQEYAQLLDLAHRLHLEVLLEVHDPAELGNTSRQESPICLASTIVRSEHSIPMCSIRSILLKQCWMLSLISAPGVRYSSPNRASRIQK